MNNPEVELHKAMGDFYHDPLGWIMFSFPWDTDPDLQIVELQEPWASRFNSKYGPDTWLCQLCDDWQAHMKAHPFDGKNAVPPFKDATASGHGIGKSACSAMVILYIASTRPFSKGVVTSNTSDQLRTKTWGELAKWKNKCITGHWFTLNNGKGNMNLFHNKYKETWRVDAITCREENSESFAGLHCANSSPWYLFDEASAVPDKIWEVAEGGTTDGEPFWFVFGNPTRNSGRFRECWRRFRNSWNKRKVDSRDVQVTNKKLLNKWKDEYGEDSDFYKVRVRGDFPSASSNQKIPGDLLEKAMNRESPHLPGDPKVMSLDVARGGSDNCVINFRQGLNGKIKKKIILPGSTYRDSMRLASKMVEQIQDFQPDMTFVDATGVGGPVSDRIRQLGFDCIDINFASASPDPHFANMRAYMADKWLQWLKDGGSVDYSEDLTTEIGAVEFTHNGKDQEILIPKDMIKKKIGVSTDEFDSEILLHAMPVAPKQRYAGSGSKPATTMGYNPWKDSDMIADISYDPFDD